MDRLIGTGVALVTPFDEQQQIDRESLCRLVNYVIGGGVDFGGIGNYGGDGDFIG